MQYRDSRAVALRPYRVTAAGAPRAPNAGQAFLRHHTLFLPCVMGSFVSEGGCGRGSSFFAGAMRTSLDRLT